MIKKLFLSAAIIVALNFIAYMGNAQNVGIGQSSPASKLDLKGNLTVGTGYSGTAAPANGAIIQGNVGIGNTSPSALLTIGTSAPVTVDNSGNVAISSLSSGSIVVTGAGGLLQIIATPEFANTFLEWDGTEYAWASAGSASLSALTPGTGLNGTAYDGSTPQTWSVNYGSASGTAVQGNTQITVSGGTGISGGGTITLGSGGTVTLNNTGILSIGVTSPILSTGGVNPTISLGTVGVANGGTGLTSAGGNGTVLEVVSGVPSWQTITASTVNGWALAGNSGTTAGTDFIGTTDATDLEIKTGVTPTERLHVVNSSGNIVIGSGEGTSSPVGNTLRAPNSGGANTNGGTLTIAGGLATGNGIGGSVNITAGTGSGTLNGGNVVITSGSHAAGSNGDIDFYLGSSGTADAVIKGTTGNVGIGTTNPLSLLHVNGTETLGTPSGGTTPATGTLTFNNSSSTSSVNISAGNTTTGYSLTLPTAQGGTNTVLTNNGSGGLTWSSASQGLANLTPGTGLTGSAYNGSVAQTFAVSYGNASGTAVQGNTQITVSAGTGMSGGGTITLGSGGTVTLNNSGVLSAGATIPLYNTGTASAPVLAIQGTAADKGSILYSNGASTAASFLASGTSGYILRSNGTSAPSWVTPSSFYGTGTTNYVARWTSATALGTGMIEDDGNTVAVNATPNGNDLLYLNNNSGNTAPTSAMHATTNSGIDFYFGYEPNFTLASGQVCSSGIGAFCNATAGNALVSSTSVTGGSGIIGNSTSGKGVYGINNVGSQGSLAAYPYGAVVGLAEDVTSGIGVIGIGNGANANANSDIPAAGSGGAFIGSTRGVYGFYTGANGGTGVEGIASGASDIAFSSGNQDFGVLGLALTSGINAGVAGYVGTFATPAATAGVYGSSSSSSVYAIYANNTNGATGTGLYVNGTTTITGNIASINGVGYTWPTVAPTTSQVLTYNGTKLVWATPTIGTVTSVGLSMPSIFNVTNSPVITSGTLTAALANETANTVFAAPNGSTGAPTFRSLVNADFPASGVTAGTYNNVTVNTQGIVTGGSNASYLTANQTITLSGDVTGSGTTAIGTTVSKINGVALGSTTATSGNLLIASGSQWVSTVVSGDATITSGGVVTVKGLQGKAISATAPTSNQVLQWNSGTSAWTPATPALGTVTSVGLSLPSIFTVTNSPVNSSGTLTGTLISQTANTIFAAPNGSAGAPIFRAFVNADLPTSGVTAGTYNNMTVNAQGIATGGSNVSYLTSAVTSVSSGNLSPLFTSSVATATSTPAISYALTNAGAETIFGNNTGSSAAPSYFTPTLASALFANQGTTTTVLHGNAGGNPSWAQVGLTTDVTGILPIANGGTGLTTAATNGQLLIGNGSGYTLGTITPGTGISVVNTAGTITISSTATVSGTAGGVLYGTGASYGTSAAGTSGQVLVSGGSGAPTWAPAFSGTGFVAGTGLSLAGSTLNSYWTFDNASNNLYNNNTGNIGIGTTTPSALFSVGAGATSPFQINGSGAIAAATGITSSGTITFSGLSSGLVLSSAGGVLSNAVAGTDYQAPMSSGTGISIVSNTISNTGVISVGASAPLSSSGGATPSISLTGTVLVANGGTGLTAAASNGQLLIGNGSGYTLGTITAGTGVSIINGSGTITTNSTSTSPWTTSGNNIYNNNTGNVGIGLTNPLQALDVSGNLQFSGALMPNSSAGVAATSVTAASAPPVVAQVLVSAGAGAAPTWNYAGGVSEILYDGGSLTSPISIGGHQTVYFVASEEGTTESLTQMEMPKCVVTRIRVLIDNNSLHGSSTITLRKNGAATAISGTISAGSTTTLVSTGNVTFNDGDLLSIQGAIGNTSDGGNHIGIIRIELTYYILP